MNKLMFTPLIVGFLCMFLAIAGTGNADKTTYNIDKEGHVTVGNNNFTALTISENGLATWGFANMLEADVVDDQVGQHQYDVNVIQTTHQQYWKVEVSSHCEVVIYLNFKDGGMTFDIQGSLGGREVRLGYLMVIDDIYQGRDTVIALDKLENSTGAVTTYLLHMVFEVQNSADNLVDTIRLGYGYSITFYAAEQDTAVGGSSGSILGPDGFVIIMYSALAIGIVTTVTIFASGIDYFGQRLIFISSVYIVIWALLSVSMSVVIIELPFVGPYIWMALTGMYLFGVSQEVLTGGE